MSDVELQDEELEALEAIYGDDCICSREERSVKIWLPNRTHSAPLVVEVRPEYELKRNYYTGCHGDAAVLPTSVGELHVVKLMWFVSPQSHIVNI